MSETTESETTDVAVELWQVRLASDEIRQMTFDELEQAFHAGVIDDTTYVLEEGTTEWKTLRHIAGGEVEQPEAETVTASDADAAASPTPDAPAEPPPDAPAEPPRDAIAPSVAAEDHASPRAASEPPPPIVMDAIDTDYDLKLVDFRPRQRAKLAIVAGAAALAAVAIVVVSLNQSPPEFPLAPPGSLPNAASTETEGEAATDNATQGAHASGDTKVPQADIDRRQPTTPARLQPSGAPASRSKAGRNRLFQRP